ncbi:BMC domain-containing protein [Amycolatopsis jejuensis]|uniref:BMC domain-containing protein n=1 Tax=Amycolatopsis jejuensis TaxID=330084 RepID=UPI000525E68A|nr:BMC domain-containing protein [Amycolatopsis jejuensis]
MHQAAGFIEAEGFVPIFDAIDAMVKATSVTVTGTIRLGGGLVAAAVTGELATVEEAIQVGAEAARERSGARVHSVIFASPAEPVAALAAHPQLLDA